MYAYIRTNKYLSLLLSIALIICSSVTIFPSAHATATAVSYDGILSLNIPETIYLTYDIQKGERYATYQFVPEESGSYTFYSISDQETSCFLRSANGTTLDADYTHSGQKNNFSLDCSLSAGVTYYFTAQFTASSSTEGSFQICIRKTINASTFKDAPIITDSHTVLPQTITSTGGAVYLTFKPATTGKYGLYQHIDCNCPAGTHSPDCDYLKNLYINVYEKNTEELDILQKDYYSTSEAHSNGFLIYDTFQAGKTYYIEIRALNAIDTGHFSLGISQSLSALPLESLDDKEHITLTTESTRQTLLFQCHISNNLKLNTTDGNYIFVKILSPDGICLTESPLTDQYLNFQVNLPENLYYVQLYSTLDIVQTFQLTIQKDIVFETPSPAPTDTLAPTPTPVITQTPLSSDTPPATQIPASPTTPISPSGQPTTSPIQTPTNIETVQPSATPDISSIPLVTEVPKETLIPSLPPEESIAPSPSAPVNTEAAANTNSPEQSELPIPSDMPEYSSSPEPVLNSPVPTTNVVSTQNTNDPQTTNGSNSVTTNTQITLPTQSPYTNTFSNNITIGNVKIKKIKKKGTKLVITWKHSKNATGYEISYGYNKNYKKTKIKRTKKYTITLKINPKKKCYIRMRAYSIVNRKRIYGKYSKKTY